MVFFELDAMMNLIVDYWTPGMNTLMKSDLEILKMIQMDVVMAQWKAMESYHYQAHVSLIFLS